MVETDSDKNPASTGVSSWNTHGEVEKFVNSIKMGDMKSYEIALASLEILKKIVGNSQWKIANDLIQILKKEGNFMVQHHVTETVLANMVRRALKIVRDEYTTGTTKGKHVEADAQDSLQKLLLDEGHVDFNKPVESLKDAIEDSFAELKTELESGKHNIAMQALEHIHADEVIMTTGHSRTVEAFLKYAAKKRKFQVVVIENAPFYHGHKMAKNLAQANIETTLIPDSAVFAIMSRVNKVIIGTHSVMANGGLKAITGAHSLALAAQHYSVPLIVCAPMFKFTPQYLCSYDQDAFNKFVSPEDVLPFESEMVSKVEVINPVFDYVPPELVKLFISNIGGNVPSYVYRLLSELYHSDDYEL